MEQIPFVDLTRIHTEIEEELIDAFKAVTDANSFIQGKFMEEFEREWAEYNKARFCVGCSSGTTALELTLKALGIGRGDEVITASNTFFATVEAIHNTGAVPILVDAKREDGLIDPLKVEEGITEKTRAIVPVHLYGQMADMAALKEIAEKHNIFLIEDAAQAHGATFLGRPPGSYSKAATFSFYPGKNLGALGDAGAVVTNDEKLAFRMKSLRDHGRQEKYLHGEFGFNMRMDGMQAAFLLKKLEKLDVWNNDRKIAARIYRENLKDIKGLNLPSLNEDLESHSFHLFVVLVEKRDQLLSALKERGVSAGIHYPVPCHKQPAWEKRYGKMHLPVTEWWADSCLSLPIFGGILEKEALAVCEAVRDAAKSL
ncbi:MAG: DegT/DnrJ/EryC1/StrS family aminotransferase [Candidatus Dadabacteria bacterium]|nr:MAG: DegT/DnrJ/EryC1/StrS family aminotransferase [Candidatus Dadabacteria bacterium]